jgi:HSP20 family protein
MAQGNLSPFGFGSQSSDPFLMLRREMEQLFDNALRAPTERPAASGAAANVIAPRMDVTEDEQEIRISAEMPGATPDNVEVTLHDDMLTIRGERQQEKQIERRNVHVMERSYGVFQRTLRLPMPVDPAQVQARFENGVLSVTIPKTGAKQRSQRIAVQSSAGDAGRGSGQGASADPGNATPSDGGSATTPGSGGQGAPH